MKVSKIVHKISCFVPTSGILAHAPYSWMFESSFIPVSPVFFKCSMHYLKSLIISSLLRQLIGVKEK